MDKILSISVNCIKLGEHFECSGNVNNPKFLHAYQDTGKVWTIGIGTIRYPNGQRVKPGDAITVEQAYQFYQNDLSAIIPVVDAFTTDAVSQQQFDALVDFTYNNGIGAYKNSTLRKVINNNPNDYEAIVTQFLRWKYDDGVEQPGLLRRRKAEAYLYCHGELKFYFTNNEQIF